MKVLIVGAGFYGATCALLLTSAGHDVKVIDKQARVGGLCRTFFQTPTQTYVHECGPHIFRTNDDEVWKFVNEFAEFNNFKDSDHKCQGIPHGGYTHLIVDMLTGIDVQLNRCYDPRMAKDYDRVIYTGSIDELFGYDDGALEYRALRFEHQVLRVEDFQGKAVVDTGTDVPYTRVIEHKHFDPINCETHTTLISREYPCTWKLGDEPFYPVNNADSNARHQRYLDRAARELPRFHFGGWLGRYRRLDMDQVIRMALDDMKAFA